MAMGIYHLMLLFLGYSVTLSVFIVSIAPRTMARPHEPARGEAGRGTEVNWRGQRLRLDRWEIEDGLPSSTVQVIVQTPDGYLWLGTEEGLVRFDGIKFTVFNSRNTKEIKHNNVQRLLADGDGTLWIGTVGGLARLKDGEFTAFTTSDGLSHNHVTALYRDSRGRLWIGTLGGGLNLLRDGGFISYSAKEGLSSNLIQAIGEDHEGSLWVGTNRGLSRLKDGKFTAGQISGIPPDLSVSVIQRGRDHNLWIGTDNGLARLKDGKLTTYTTTDGLSHQVIKALFEDGTGSLWIGTDDGGLNLLEHGKFFSLSAKDGLANNFMRAVYRDREGDLWIGLLSGGLHRLRENRFITYGVREGLVHEAVNAVYQSRDGTIWAGTQGGLSRFKDGRFTNYTIRDGLPDNRVGALCEDRAGSLWIGTDGGLVRFKDGRFTVYRQKQGLSSDMIRAIYEDRQGDLWIGTRGGGLDRFKDGKFTGYAGRGFPSTAARAIYEDRAGNLWIGGNNGLSRFRDEQFTTYTTRHGLPHQFVLSIVEDMDVDGTLWFGTYGGGLSRLKDGKFIAYTSLDGLFADVINQVLDDGRGNLWMSCSQGVFRVSKRQLNDFAEGKIKTVVPVSYGVADGMRSSECTGGIQPAGWKARDGRLWFPTARGVVVVSPAEIATGAISPTVHIESLTADERTTVLTPKAGAIEFPPGTARIEIGYTGVALSAPEKVRFRYRLENFDDDWIEAGSRRVAYYTNLPPGRYRFQVIASNSDGVWSESGAAGEFYLRPYFYQRSWFYLLCVMGMGATGWGIYRIRISQVKSRFAAVLAERSRIAREMHDTLIQGVIGASALLTAVSRMMAGSPQQAHEYLEIARGELTKSLNEVRTAVTRLREPTAETESLAEEVGELVRRMTVGKAVEARCEVRGTPRPLPEAVAENLLRIVREAIANAVRHAAADQIVVELDFWGNGVELRVSDDGRGFEPERESAGGGAHFGLIGMRERAETIGAELTLSSRPGSGTQVAVRVTID